MRLLSGSTRIGRLERTWFVLRRHAPWVCLVMLNMGCFSSSARQAQELLEADLRSQERHIQELKAELDRKEGVIHGLDYEVERMQQSASGARQPGEPQAPGIVKDIALGRLTGGYQQNARINFDDSLQVVLEPRDSDGHAIKVPGSVHIDLFEITPQGLKTPLSSWDISQRELRRLWDQPLIGGPSYRIILPWKAIPTMDKLRVVARFTTLDGKLYEAERDVTIKLPPGAPRPGLPIGVPGGYSVVTPNRRAPAPAPVAELAAQPMPSRVEMAPKGKEAALPSQTAAVKELPRPSPPEQKTQKEPEPAGSIPVIPFLPRELAATPTSQGMKTGQEPTNIGNSPVPSLPPPPEIPTLDGKKPVNLNGMETLPQPRTSTDAVRPLEPGQNTPQPQAQPQGGMPLTGPPPQAWRERHQAIVQVQQNEPMIKLSRPITKTQSGND
jgi:hypothetical protein